MKISFRKEHLFLLILFLFALGLRLVYLGQLRDSPLFDAPIMDAEYHDQWALAIRDGQPFHEGPYFRAPLYAYFLAGIYTLFGHSYLAARVVQFFIGSLSVLLVYFLGKRTFGPAVGKIAAALACVNGAFIYFEGELLIPVLIVFLDLVLVLAVLSAQERPAWWRWLGCGAILGLSAIARPNVLLFGAVLVPWVMMRLRRRGLSMKKSLVHISGLLLGTVLTILPVTVRNCAVSGDFVPIASQGGVNFFIGNNQQADGVTAIVPGTRDSWWGGYHDAIALAEEAEGRSLKASEVSNYWFKRGLKFVQDDPGAYLRLLLKKLALFWGGAEISNNKNIYFYSSMTPLLAILIRPGPIFCPFGILAPLALVGMLLAWRRKERKGQLLTVFVFSYMASVVLFFVNARYRLPVIPFLLPFAAYGLVYLFRNRRQARVVPSMGLILALGLGINLNLAGYPVSRLEDSYARLGYAYLVKKMYQQAEVEFHRALSINPQYRRVTPARLYSITGLAQVYQETGELDKAIDRWKEAVSLRPYMTESLFLTGPEMKNLRYQLACAYYARGRLEDAIAQWEEILRLWPRAMESYIKLGNAKEDRGQYHEAIAVLERAIQVNPRYYLAYYNLGNLYTKLARFEEAADRYKRAIEINPNFADAYINLAWLYSQINVHLDEGIELVMKALQMDAGVGAYWETLAELYIKKGELERARGIFRQMIKREPEETYWRRRLEELGG
ncbi:MAG: hypothetical protein AMJ92_05430 [candidate division Zixibacteria bacterium SM23_81]|nr:MAG: hypothetical protein AMJ92_05430 [candidate division Zixibacteria bacterium SM23_81]